MTASRVVTAARKKRPGFGSVSNLPDELRQVLEPMVEILNRVVLSSQVDKIGAIDNRTSQTLAAGATLADTITRVNELATALNVAITKVNELIKRLQED